MEFTYKVLIFFEYHFMLHIFKLIIWMCCEKNVIIVDFLLKKNRNKTTKSGNTGKKTGVSSSKGWKGNVTTKTHDFNNKFPDTAALWTSLQMKAENSRLFHPKHQSRVTGVASSQFTTVADAIHSLWIFIGFNAETRSWSPPTVTTLIKKGHRDVHVTWFWNAISVEKCPLQL